MTPRAYDAVLAVAGWVQTVGEGCGNDDLARLLGVSTNRARCLFRQAIHAGYLVRPSPRAGLRPTARGLDEARRRPVPAVLRAALDAEVQARMTATTQRACLRCRRAFESPHAGVRLCNDCRAYAAQCEA